MNAISRYYLDGPISIMLFNNGGNNNVTLKPSKITHKETAVSGIRFD
jgi:hypothetical protein